VIRLKVVLLPRRWAIGEISGLDVERHFLTAISANCFAMSICRSTGNVRVRFRQAM